MISGLLSNDNPLGSFSALIDQFGPMLGLLAAINPEMTRICLSMAKSMIDEMIRVYDETGMLVFPAMPDASFFEQRAEATGNAYAEAAVAATTTLLQNHYAHATENQLAQPIPSLVEDVLEAVAVEPDVSLDMLNDVQLQAARALYAEAAKDGFMGVYAPTEENFRLLREWQEEKEHAPTEKPKQRRKRRTKVQIAADNAAKLARSESTAE